MSYKDRLCDGTSQNRKHKCDGVVKLGLPFGLMTAALFVCAKCSKPASRSKIKSARGRSGQLGGPAGISFEALACFGPRIKQEQLTERLLLRWLVQDCQRTHFARGPVVVNPPLGGAFTSLFGSRTGSRTILRVL
jgi:hypothetical protein